MVAIGGIHARVLIFSLTVCMGVCALLSCGRGEPPTFDGASAYRFLLEQCDMGPRHPGSDGHARVRRYLVRRFGEFGANVSLQPFEGVLTTGDTLHLVNIIGNYNLGSRERVLLGAHYDTRPYADRDPDRPTGQSRSPGPTMGAAG